MMGTDEVMVSSDNVLSLAVGATEITVTVTAEDGTTMMPYTITVTRAAPLSSEVTLQQVLNAITAYIRNETNALSRAELLELITRYIRG
jgi:hypothetical protein